MAEVSLKVLEREEKGKQASKRLRKQGYIPAVLYGLDLEPTSLSIEGKELILLLHTSGRNAVFNLSIGKKRKKYKTFIYDIQHDPLSGDIIHVDLKQISLDEKINVTVSVRLNGLPYGVKNEGGIIEHMLHSIDISCLPNDIPGDINLDISELHLGDVIHVSDLKHDNYEILTGEDSVIVHVITPKVVKVEEVDEISEEEEGPEEPEVIGEEE